MPTRASNRTNSRARKTPHAPIPTNAVLRNVSVIPFMHKSSGWLAHATIEVASLECMAEIRWPGSAGAPCVEKWRYSDAVTPHNVVASLLRTLRNLIIANHDRMPPSGLKDRLLMAMGDLYRALSSMPASCSWHDISKLAAIALAPNDIGPVTQYSDGLPPQITPILPDLPDAPISAPEAPSVASAAETPLPTYKHPSEETPSLKTPAIAPRAPRTSEPQPIPIDIHTVERCLRDVTSSSQLTVVMCVPEVRALLRINHDLAQRATELLTQFRALEAARAQLKAAREEITRCRHDLMAALAVADQPDLFTPNHE